MNIDSSQSPASGKNLRDRISLWDKLAIISEEQQDGVVQLTNLASLSRQVRIPVFVFYCIRVYNGEHRERERVCISRILV